MKQTRASILLALALASSSQAYTFNKPQKFSSSKVVLSSANKDINDSNNAHHFGKIIAAAAAASVFTAASFSPPAVAFVPQSQMVPMSSLSSSSIDIAEAIKTLDFSLPSYDKIAAPKANQDDIEGVEVKTKKSDNADKKEKETSSPSSGAVAAKKKSSSFMSSSAGSISGPTAQEKKAKAEAAKAEKEKQIEEKKNEKIEIIGMDMPSYSTGSATKKSAFSL